LIFVKDLGHQQKNSSGQKNIAFAFFLNLGFTLVEIVGGYLTNSMAIQSDALHDAGDTVALGLAWYFQILSDRKRTDAYTFGYKRFNTLGALVTGIILVAGSVYIFMEAIPRLIHPEETNARGMMWLAFLGIAVNGLAVYNVRKGENSLNERMISWHLMEDILGWIAVLIGSIVMQFTDALWIDPILSILLTSYILFNVFKNLIEAFKIIMQRAPSSVKISEIIDSIESFPKVRKSHHVHIWSLDGDYTILTAHVVVSPELTLEEVESLRKEIESKLHSGLDIQHTTLQFETETSPEGDLTP
jgi:cobalt-zinc-cadmium efflux system protein